ncbi:uncharacterized protein [Trachinotus anak]|uniref:uncharacterized protein isoform X6 n=1 Tax=Trachinotus anak TaxID=443729 RepID=UPI0039F19B4F
MMKYVQSVALFLLMMVMMMTMMASVSAGPLRPSLNHSRHDDEETASLENKEENSNRLESRQDVNNTLDNITGNVTSNSSMSDTPSVRLEETLQELDKTEDDSTQTRKDLYLTQSGSTAWICSSSCLSAQYLCSDESQSRASVWWRPTSWSIFF